MSRERIMLTQAIPAVQQLRRVQGFDPLRFLKRNANGGIELEPRYQRLWFRLACPDGKMLLNRLRVTDQIAVYEAQVFLSREDNQPITNFTAAVEKAQAPAGRYVQAAQDEALKTALDNAGFGIQLCEINPSAAVDAQADGKQEVATDTVNRQETAPAVNRAAAPQREASVGENHPVQAVPTPQEVQPQEEAKTPNVNQQEVHTTQQTESVSDAMSLLQALSGGTAASEPDPVRLTWNPNYKGIDDWQLALRRKEQKMKEDPGMTFKEQYLNGLCGLEMLEACKEKWHAMKVDSISLRDYLGLTEQEYDAYLQTDPGVSFQKLLDSQRKMQRFRVYQLDLEHGETRAFAFGGIDALHKAGFQQPPAAEYTLVYDGELTCPVGQDECDILERIFARYNQAFPPDYRGRSIAPSDVLELYDESERRYFYCDMAGFLQVKFSPALAKKA